MFNTKILQIPFQFSKDRPGFLEVKLKCFYFNEPYILEEYAIETDKETGKTSKILYASVEISKEEYQNIRTMGFNTIVRDAVAKDDTIKEDK